MMQPVTLINSFEVPEGEEEEFLAVWNQVGERLRQAPGFLSTRLHRSLDPQAKFRFVNIAQWESPEHFQAAMNSEALLLRQQRSFTAYPVLYQVISE